MRVAHITDKYPVTGEYYVYDQLRLSRHPCLLLSERLFPGPRPLASFASWYAQPRGEIGDLMQRVCANRITCIYRMAFNAWLTLRITHYKPDIIHAHFLTNAWKALPAARKSGLPLVVTAYGVDVSSCLRNSVWIKRYKAVFEYASRIIVLAEEVVDRLIAAGCPRDKIVVWNIGVAVREYKHRLPHAGKRMLCVARFVEKKGHFVLLDALARVPDITLTLMGNGPLKQKILEGINRRGLQRRVSLIDTTGCQDFYELFRNALETHDVFVMPSIIARDGDDEGGPPVVIAFAQAAGLPVVATPIGGITRAIKDNKTGLLAHSGDPIDLARVLRRMIRSARLRCRLSRNARAFVEQHFDARKQVREVDRLHVAVLAEVKG